MDRWLDGWIVALTDGFGAPTGSQLVRGDFGRRGHDKYRLRSHPVSSSPTTQALSKSTTRWVVALTGIGSLMAALDTLVVSTALSTIRVNLHASVSQLEWTVNAYNLTFAVLLITGAALGDRLGRRRMFAAGVGLFAVASAACALAPDVGLLIVARAVQGAGAALLTPLALALLTAAFPPEKRGTAIGIFSAITGLAVASGPLVGGAVVQGISWEWIFWINVPIGLLAIPFILRKIPESFGADTALDVRGLGLVSVGALGIVWGLVRGNSVGWGSAEVVSALVLGSALLAAFIAWERRARAPMLPIEFFRSRSFSAGNAAIFLIFASLFGTVFFYAQLLQTGLGYGPLGAGLRLLPYTATFMTVAPVAGAMADRIGERPLMVTGLALQATGMAWLALIVTPGLAYTSMLAPFLVAGVGVSLAIPSAQNSVMASVSLKDLGQAAGANSMMRELGGVFGIAVAVAAFAAAGNYSSPAAFIDGFGPAIGVASGLAAVGAIVALGLPGRRTTTAQPLATTVPAVERDASS
jgi:EmrB/QacA subfamily drug resistance transporter